MAEPTTIDMEAVAEFLADRRLATRNQARSEVCKIALFLADRIEGGTYSREAFLTTVGNGLMTRVDPSL